jgi:cytochrome P450
MSKIFMIFFKNLHCKKVNFQILRDVLGSTIFNYEFNSLKGEMGSGLISFNYIMSSLFNVKNILLLTLTKNFQSFIPFHQRLTSKSNEFLELVKKFIEHSKEKLKNGEQANSMLDFMVESFLENEISQQELETNVFIFFAAGHET